MTLALTVLALACAALAARCWVLTGRVSDRDDVIIDQVVTHGERDLEIDDLEHEVSATHDELHTAEAEIRRLNGIVATHRRTQQGRAS